MDVPYTYKQNTKNDLHVISYLFLIGCCWEVKIILNCVVSQEQISIIVK